MEADFSTFAGGSCLSAIKPVRCCGGSAYHCLIASRQRERRGTYPGMEIPLEGQSTEIFFPSQCNQDWLSTLFLFPLHFNFQPLHGAFNNGIVWVERDFRGSRTRSAAQSRAAFKVRAGCSGPCPVPSSAFSPRWAAQHRRPASFHERLEMGQD